ncbi:RNA-directed DNA polymerase, eukaryota [Tanacetum coccineum]
MAMTKKGLGQRAKKDWIKELCTKNKVNFVSLQETKMETIELFNVKECWGNFAFEYKCGASVGNSGGILCIWDPSMFRNTMSTASDYFIMVKGEWVPSGKKLLIISIYAPQELKEKKMLWDYLIMVINNWNGEVVIMGDFNEVRMQTERFGSKFNVHGADIFNSFIATSQQQADLECNVTSDEIKRAVWDCGVDKSPGPDGFTFGFYRRHIHRDRKVGGLMSRIKSWEDIMNTFVARLSKWKMKTLSIGGPSKDGSH